MQVVLYNGHKTVVVGVVVVVVVVVVAVLIAVAVVPRLCYKEYWCQRTGIEGTTPLPQ